MTVCFDAVRMTNLGNRHRTDWLLAGADALKPECRGSQPSIEPFSYTPGPSLDSRRISRITEGLPLAAPSSSDLARSDLVIGLVPSDEA